MIELYKGILDLSNLMTKLQVDIHDSNLKMLSGLLECEDKSPNKPPYELNYLAQWNTTEPLTSWIIRYIFDYTFNGRHPYLDSFLDRFLKDIGLNSSMVDKPIIIKDHEYKYIDVLIRDKNYALIIENKVKGALFQSNQLARYIETMRQEGYTDSQIFIVILPKEKMDLSYLNDSVWRLPKDWRSSKANRKCCNDDCSCWCDAEDYMPKAHCTKCIDFKKEYKPRTVVIREELANWLFDCSYYNSLKLPKLEYRKQYVLNSAIMQFVDYLKGIYKTRENHKYMNEIQTFLKQQLGIKCQSIEEQLDIIADKQKEIEELSTQLDNLNGVIQKKFITQMCKKHGITLKYDDEWYFHYNITIEKRKLSLLVNEDRTNYYCQLEGVNDKNIPEIVLNNLEIADELNDPYNTSNKIWKYDSYTESIKRFERVLGILLKQNS